MSRFVGSDLRRPEGPDKVAGRAPYVADLVPPGCWVGGTVRSPLARGRLLALERERGFDFGRVVVVEARDVPGDNVVALIEDDQPLLAERELRHVGEPIALVAAPDRPTLEAALAALRPRVEALEPELDAFGEREATAERDASGAGERSPRILAQLRFEKGSVAAAFAAPPPGARVVAGVYRTASQEQMYVEPQGALAYPPQADGTLVVHGSLQCPHYVQKALCRAFALAPAKARVVQAETGGGFGGKEEYPSVVACHAALLARAAGRPVALLYERQEDLAVTPKRHPARVAHETLVAADGSLLAARIEIVLDGGAYTTLSPVVLSRAAIHALGPYRCAHVAVEGRVVATNHVPYGAFRGFGAPQVTFAYERHMDAIAKALALHPVELRRRNLLRLGDATATGQVLRESVGSEAVLARVLERTRFDERAWAGIAPPGIAPPVDDAPTAVAHQSTRAALGKARGRGLSFFFHGAGFTGAGEERLKGRVRVALADDGRLRVHAGSTEIGQGTRAMFLALAAESAGAELADVELVAADTGLVPDSGPTVASRTCMVVGGCLARACAELARRIGAAPAGEARQAGASFRERARAFAAQAGAAERVVEVSYGSPPGLLWDEERYQGDAYPVYGWGCDYVELEVDLASFELEVTRFVTAVDVGRAIQPALVRGQIEGGSLQALGWAHLERVSTREGRFVEDRMATCIVPTALDTPRFEVVLVEEPFAHGPFGAKGIGELPMDGGAPAVASALQDALGIALARVPATPEALLEAWLAAHPAERLGAGA